VRHWRAYSLSSDPARSDRCISVTVKHVQEGQVSPYLVRKASPGTIVYLGGVEGTFRLPDPAPERMLMITGGSGVTPIMAMLRRLEHEGHMPDTVLVHSAPTGTDVIFGRELRALTQRFPAFRLHEQHTRTRGRFTPDQLDALVPDWRERETFLCGPAGMLEAVTDHFEQAGIPERLHQESFQPVIGGGQFQGDGGTITLTKSGIEAESDGSTPILAAAEAAGAEMPFGCRMGICHTCVGRLRSGNVRDLRTGEVHELAGQFVRTCINAPEGPIELEL
jgi:ferredoxin-NADP reductase